MTSNESMTFNPNDIKFSYDVIEGIVPIFTFWEKLKYGFETITTITKIEWRM